MAGSGAPVLKYLLPLKMYAVIFGSPTQQIFKQHKVIFSSFKFFQDHNPDHKEDLENW